MQRISKMTVGVVGLGLIGGSVCASIRRGTNHLVLGEDLNPEAEEKALHFGWIQGTLEGRREECDVIFLALYPAAALKYLEIHGMELSPNVLIMDTCGVKKYVLDGVHQLQGKYNGVFLGVHPMAGREFSGIDYAQEDLFDGAAMILTPEDTTPLWAIERAEQLGKEMGFGRMTIASPERHDRIIAYTSQLAHILANAYVKSPRAMEFSGFSAGSLKDQTRVARLNETMWTELFMENSACLAEELTQLIEQLELYLKALKTEDADMLRELLKDGRMKKEEMEKISGGSQS